jgi:KaiC/GvpD/RAD55 family RecA-like ATPase
LSAPTREYLDKGLALGLKGLEYCKKTDANWIQLALCGRVSQLYSTLGELKLAEEYLLKASEPSTSPYQFIVFLEVTGARGAFLAAKGQFNESIKATEEMLKFLETYKSQSVEGEVRLTYATELQKLGFGEEAEVQFDKGQKLLCSFKEQVEANFGHTYVKLGLLLPRKMVVDEEFEMRVDLVNASREQGFLQKLEGIILSEMNCVCFPSFCSVDGSGIVLNDKKIGPFEVVTIKLRLKASKPGIYRLNPKLSYADELGKTKICDSEPIDLTVEVAKQPFEILAGRVATGTLELDRILMGGIPEKYAVALISASTEERQKLTANYVEAGLKNGETTFYLANESGIAVVWAEKYPSSMFLFVCNSRSELIAKDLPNVYKLKGVDSLTGIDIALAKAFRHVDSSNVKPKRACIEIVSDVLLQHHAVTTRKWLGGAIQELKFRGFVVLAVIDPSMHPSEEVSAIRGLFDGEISIYEKETGKGSARFLKVKRLSNQKYAKDETLLT